MPITEILGCLFLMHNLAALAQAQSIKHIKTTTFPLDLYPISNTPQLPQYSTSQILEINLFL